MNTVKTCIKNYLEYCHSQKCLDEKTLKAYRIDLRQFSEQNPYNTITEITSESIEQYIAHLHTQYKPKTVKRKIASFIFWQNTKLLFMQNVGPVTTFL